MQHTLPSSTDRWSVAALFFGLVGLFIVNLAGLTFVDPDLFHEMALIRETWVSGALPLDDRFAYTPTVYPSVHHEWGTGAVLYAVAQSLGASGIMALKYLLSIVVVGGCVRVARERGAGWPLIAAVASVPILCGCIGFTTIRAQLFTLVFLAMMLGCIEADRRGERRWMWLWLPAYVAWLNLHAGFVVGAGLMALHAFEQLLRKEPIRHWIVLGVAMAALVLVNPYGAMYYPYLAHGLLMLRPMIIEWRPLWHVEPISMFYVYLFSVLLMLYAVSSLGWRRMPGLLMLLASTYFAVRHTRHLSLYFVIWFAYVPGYLQQTRLGELAESIWQRRRRFVLAASCAIGVLSLLRAAPAKPWQLRMPTTLAEEETGRPMYPTGAVDYLRRLEFSGNMMVPFVPGGFVSWKLHPRVKVSLDGRYEVAYRPGILEENEHMYQAKDGWHDTLEKYPTDVLLVPNNTPLAREMTGVDGWTPFYHDASYTMYARPGLELPLLDRGDVTVPGQFP